MASSSSQKQRNRTPVTPLNPHDVLFGRGSGANEFEGNKSFRALVEQHKDEYAASAKHKHKKKIAQQIYNQIRSLGGRFMKQVETDEQLQCVVTDCVWKEVSNEKAALEKIKQSLRQHREGKTDDSTKVSHAAAGIVEAQRDVAAKDFLKMAAEESLLLVPAPTAGPLQGHQTIPRLQSKQQTNKSSSPSPPTTIVETRLLLFQQTPLGYGQQHHLQSRILPRPLPTNALLHCFQVDHSYQRAPFVVTPPVAALPTSVALQDLRDSAAAAAAQQQQYFDDIALYTKMRDLLHIQSNPATGVTVSEALKSDGQAAGDMIAQQQNQMNIGTTESADSRNSGQPKREPTPQSPTQGLEEDEVLAFLLSFLGDPDQPRLSLQEIKAEYANLTDEEKASALSDVFGVMCEYNTQHQDKKTRRDLDPTSIDFLLKQMRLELEGIPTIEKPAWLEAQKIARPEEFCNDRLLRFLRCDGMNAKLAARRFVNYWEGRLEVFGPQRFALPITLSEALYGDTEAICALEAGVLCLLPHLDLSGRQLLFLEPCRHTRIGYTSMSLLRAVWYTIETAANNNTDIVSGIVEIVWDKESTVWDYDPQAYDRWTYFETHAWPIQITAFHVCCPPSFIKRIIYPIMMALTDQRGRARTLIHDVPASEIVQVLSSYGILKHMLPTVIGGDLIFDQNQWIINRRVAELEEL